MTTSKSDPLAAIRALIDTWRAQSKAQQSARKGLRRNTPANAFKEGVQIAVFDCANALAERVQPLKAHLAAQAQQIAALTTMLGAPEGSDPVAAMRRAIYDAEQAARAAGRPEGEYLRDSIAALMAQLGALEELLRSAHAIAARKGEHTAWDRFAASCQALGIGSVTARVYRVLPSDEEPPDSLTPEARCQALEQQLTNARKESADRLKTWADCRNTLQIVRKQQLEDAARADAAERALAETDQQIGGSYLLFQRLGMRQAAVDLPTAIQEAIDQQTTNLRQQLAHPDLVALLRAFESGASSKIPGPAEVLAKIEDLRQQLAQAREAKTHHCIYCGFITPGSAVPVLTEENTK